MRALLIPVIALFTIAPSMLHAQEDGATAEEVFLPVSGRVTDGENKMAGCEIVLYKGNERISSVTTDKSGKFNMLLDLNQVWGIEFVKEGFVAKRMVFNTTMPKMSKTAEVIIAPISMEVSLLERMRYDGANTDDLDFPFAMVKWDKGQQTFAQDQEYNMDMQRTNGALLLMAARSDKH